MPGVQFIESSDGEPLFAVIPYKEYLHLRSQVPQTGMPVTPSLLSADGRFIRLPNAGPGVFLDVLKLADLVERRGLLDLAINQRAQSLDKFPPEQRSTLDPLIRRAFLPAGSSYTNTMQATNEVVDAIVQTGLFRRIQKTYDLFYRPVKALQVVPEALEKFLAEHGRPVDPINTGLV